MENVNPKIRQPAVSGAFYPEDKKELNSLIENFLNSAEKELAQSGIQKKIGDKSIKAIIAPHAGYIYSGQVAAFGYQSLLRNAQNYAELDAELRRKSLRESALSQHEPAIILLGPSHYVFADKPYADSNDFWLTPFGKVEVNQNLIQKLKLEKNSAAHEQEHSIEVQLPFLQYMTRINTDIHTDLRGYYGNFSIVPIVLNKVDDDLIEKLVKISNETIIIVSSDLSHFLPYKEAVLKDKQTINAILNLDEKAFLNLGENTACGAAGILTLIKIAKKLNWRPHLLKYLNSGDTAGDKNRVVGYASIAFVKNSK